VSLASVDKPRDGLSPAPPESGAQRERLRSLDVRTTGHPLDPGSRGTLIKPAELVDVVEISSLNRSELVLYNQLLAHAWNDMAPGKVYSIKKAVLRGSHESNDRLQDAFDNLMRAFAKIRYRDPKTGRAMTTRINLLGPNTEEDADEGSFYYTFHDSLFRILEGSHTWARLKSEIMYLLRSKYSIRLYEMIERRINLHAQSETFTVDQFRALLAVPDDKLPRFADFNKHALQPALQEINQLTDYAVAVGVIKRGRTVEKLHLSWLKKSADALQTAVRERDASRIGRSARRNGKVEVIL
jgi:plasmid replication initiation protein